MMLRRAVWGFVVAAGLLAAWWSVLPFAAEFPLWGFLCGVGGVYVSVVCVRHGATVWAAVAAPVAAAAAVEAWWAAVNYALDPPHVWLDRPAAAVAVAAAIGVAAWTVGGGRVRAAGRGAHQIKPLRVALAASGVRALGMPQEGEPDPVNLSKSKRVGLGEATTVRLPAGVSAGDVAAHSGRIAAALFRPASEVRIDVGAHAREVSLWVSDKDAAQSLGDDVRAVSEAVGRSYLDAVIAGDIEEPSVAVHVNGRIIEVRLPAGVVASKFNREAFAAALNVSEGRVRKLVSDTPSMLRIEVLDVDPKDMPAPVWPLLEGAPFDFRGGVPMGVADDGARVDAVFHSHAALFGGQRGSGKTTAMRNVVAAAALDPDVKLFVIDLKGEDDWSMFQGRAEVFDNSGDPESAGRVVEQVEAERQSRSAMKRATPGMKFPSLVLVVDEFHKLTPQAQKTLETTGREGRSTAVDIICGTQVPTKSSGVSTELMEQFDVRWVGRLTADWAADKLYPAGFRDYLGVDPGKALGKGRAWLLRDDEAVLIRTYFVAREQVEGVVQRTRSGAAAGESLRGEFTAADTALLRQVESGAPAAAWRWDGGRDVRNRMEVAAQMRALEEIEALELANRRAVGESAEQGDGDMETVDVARLAEDVAGAWPRGQRGRLQAAWLSVLAEGIGVDEGWLDAALSDAGAPVEKVRMLTPDGLRPWRQGMSRARFDTWREAV